MHWLRAIGFVAAAFFCNTVTATSSKLLVGGTIIAYDEETGLPRIIRNGTLLIEGDRISSLFDSTAPGNVTNAEVIDCTNKIITPGFIDTHRHGWQTVFKTMGSNTSLGEYFFRYSPIVASSIITAEEVYISQLMGVYEALNAGVTTTLDHAHASWSRDVASAAYNASVDSGARIFYAYAFQNNTEDWGVTQQISHWRELVSANSSDLMSLGIAYESWGAVPIPSSTTEVVDLINEGAVAVLSTHDVEGPWVFPNAPEDLHRVGVLNTSLPIVIAHASFVSARGAQLLRSTDQYISITPESEFHYGHLNPTSHLIQDQASLGVDTHFTFSTDILTQARLWLQTARARLYAGAVVDRWQIPANNPMSAAQAFLLATRNGGLALGREDLGIIAPGAKADVVVWDGRSPALLGWADPIAAIILHASVGDIEHVLVDGEFVKRDRRLIVDGYENLQQRFLDAAEHVQQVLRESPLPPSEGQFLTGYEYGTVLQADTLRGNGTGYGPSYA